MESRDSLVQQCSARSHSASSLGSTSSSSRPSSPLRLSIRDSPSRLSRPSPPLRLSIRDYLIRLSRPAFRTRRNYEMDGDMDSYIDCSSEPESFPLRLSIIEDSPSPFSLTSNSSSESVLRLPHRISLTYKADVNTSHFTDTSNDSWITGGVMLDNNLLSLVDYLTYSVKIIDVTSNSVISCIRLSKRPWDITRVKPNQVVVTCYDTLLFIKVGGTLSVVKEVHTSNFCSGIVCTNTNLIVSFLYPGSVKILDLEGRLKEEISTDNNGQPLFEAPSCIALSPDQETLYVSDEEKQSVTSMDLNGTVQHVFKLETLKYPRNLAVDLKGYIYVAGRGPYTMHVISPQGITRRLVHEDMADGIKKPFAIIYCKKQNVLYISQIPVVFNHKTVVTSYTIQKKSLFSDSD